MNRLIANIDKYSVLLVATIVIASILPVYGQGAKAVEWASRIAITALFFLHGSKLSRSSIIGGFLHWKLHFTVVSFTFLAFPILGLIAYALAGPILTPDFASGLLFLTLLPSTVQSSIAFTAMAGGNVSAAICAASLSNLIGIALTPVLVGLLMSSSGGGGISLEGVQTIVFQLLLPFIAGHLARPLIGGFVDGHKKLVMMVDRGSILLIVYAAFSAAVVEGLWHKAPVWQVGVLALFSLVMLMIVLLLTHLASRLLHFSAPDTAAVVFAGSKKSLASGVPIAGALFPASMVGGIILPLMIFHQLQLLACAVIAQRMRRASTGPAAIPTTPAGEAAPV